MISKLWKEHIILCCNLFTTMNALVDRNTELRKIPAGQLYNLAVILQNNNDWKKVMSLVPRNPRSEYFEPKYTKEHIKQIEDHARNGNKNCAEVLFDEWGTSGRIRPTLSTLKEVVDKAGILRAADVLADMLQEERQPRPDEGPGAAISVNITEILEAESNEIPSGSTKQISDSRKPISFGDKTTKVVTSNTKDETQENLPNLSLFAESENEISADNQAYQMSIPSIGMSGIDSDILSNRQLIDFSYKELESITMDFSETLIYIPGQNQGKLAGRIGTGGFGDVFAGFHPVHGQLAVKKARSLPKYDDKPDMSLKIFNSEVKFLSQLRHKNIVPIIGFSKDGPALCIICEYVDGGSLDQKIANKIYLTERQRLQIMIGTAEGLSYLHGNLKPLDSDEKSSSVSTGFSIQDRNFVHGDVKSGNILLTRDCVPKLCDFGLARKFDPNRYLTSAPMGTAAYMPPEGFSGTITPQSDVYSFGIVVLELLTGLKPVINIGKSNHTKNIKDHLEDIDIHTVLCPFIDKWSKSKEIYSLARSCLEYDRKKRPSSQAVFDTLTKLLAEKESDESSDNQSNLSHKSSFPYSLLESSQSQKKSKK